MTHFLCITIFTLCVALSMAWSGILINMQNATQIWRPDVPSQFVDLGFKSGYLGAAVTMNGKVYMFPCVVDASYGCLVNVVSIFDPMTNQTTRTMQLRRSYIRGVQVAVFNTVRGQQMIACGWKIPGSSPGPDGYDTEGRYTGSKCELLKDNQWRALNMGPSKGLDPSSFTLTSVFSKVYMIGGGVPFGLGQAFEYDGNTGIWTERAMAIRSGTYEIQQGSASVMLDTTHLLVCGGQDLNTYAIYRACQTYDTVEDVWTIMPESSWMIHGRQGHAMKWYGGRIYVIGGVGLSGHGHVDSSVEVFDPITQTFVLTPFPVIGVPAINNDIFVRFASVAIENTM